MPGQSLPKTHAAHVPDLVMMRACDLAAAIRTKQVSCAEVMRSYLGHIDRINPHVNAIVSRVEEPALVAAAGAADRDLAAGFDRGWMHGLPHAVKDVSATAGLRTTYGSPLFADFIPSADAIFVERLRRGGAILIGKTNVPEFGLGSHTYNRVMGTTLNAYDQAKTAGGSSGGAGVALALRMLPVADGTDIGGSLRNPASWNNVYGFRPSAGRVPAAPATELFLEQLQCIGPMARNVTDLALLLSVMAGRDDRAPLSLTAPAEAFAAGLASDVAGMRIGWLGDLGGIPFEPGMLDLCLSGLRRLEGAGCRIEEAHLGVSRDMIWQSFITLRQVLFAGRYAKFHEDPAKRAQMKPEAIWELEAGLGRSGVEVYQASVQRSAVYEAFRRLFERFDFLVLPTAQVFPFDAAEHWPTAIAGVAMDSYHRWMEISAGPTLAGLPVAAVPAGFNGAGLPAGFQLIGPPQQDVAVLHLAYAYEQVSGPELARLPDLLIR